MTARPAERDSSTADGPGHPPVDSGDLPGDWQVSTDLPWLVVAIGPSPADEADLDRRPHLDIIWPAAGDGWTVLGCSPRGSLSTEIAAGVSFDDALEAVTQEIRRLDAGGSPFDLGHLVRDAEEDGTGNTDQDHPDADAETDDEPDDEPTQATLGDW